MNILNNKSKKEAYQYEKELLVKYTALLEKNYEKLSTFYNENAKLYHDMNHHLNALYNLLEGGKQLEAKEYIEEIITLVIKCRFQLLLNHIVFLYNIY